jgi:hypothetical protein
MRKYEKYQDYVIKNGKLVGEFEQMYIDHNDPWEQSKRDLYSSEWSIILNWVRKIKKSKQKLKSLRLVVV